MFSNFLSTPAKAHLAPFKVAHRIAKHKKPHTIAKELILPAAIDLVSTMIGDLAAQEPKTVPLSNNTICSGGYWMKRIGVPAKKNLGDNEVLPKL